MAKKKTESVAAPAARAVVLQASKSACADKVCADKSAVQSACADKVFMSSMPTHVSEFPIP
jgi:hypothetical protein